MPAKAGRCSLDSLRTTAMTAGQTSRIVHEAAAAFRQVCVADAGAVQEFLELLEHAPIAAGDAVLLLAELEVLRRKLMRRIAAGALELRRHVAEEEKRAAA